MFFYHFYIYIYKKTTWVFFWRNHFSVFLNHLFRGSYRENSPLFLNWNISCDKQQASKQINLNCFRKMRTDRRSNGGMSHFVWCETKPNSSSILCMKICLCCVWHILITLFCLYFVLLSYTIIFPGLLDGEIWFWANFKISFALDHHSQNKHANQDIYLTLRLLHHSGVGDFILVYNDNNKVHVNIILVRRWYGT